MKREEFNIIFNCCRLRVAGCRLRSAGCRVQGAGCRVQDARCRLQIVINRMITFNMQLATCNILQLFLNHATCNFFYMTDSSILRRCCLFIYLIRNNYQMYVIFCYFLTNSSNRFYWLRSILIASHLSFRVLRVSCVTCLASFYAKSAENSAAAFNRDCR